MICCIIKKEFLDILWCQRYGTDKGDKGPCRGANPISCSHCSLHPHCPSYQSIKNSTIVVDDNLINLEKRMNSTDSFFGILTDAKTPRKVYTKGKVGIDERDSHSGLDIPSQTKIDNRRMTIEQFRLLLIHSPS